MPAPCPTRPPRTHPTRNRNSASATPALALCYGPGRRSLRRQESANLSLILLGFPNNWVAMNRKERRAASKRGNKNTNQGSRASVSKPTSSSCDVFQTAKVLLTEANSLLSAGRIDDAAEKYIAVLAVDENNVDALNNLGVVFGRCGRLEKAIAHFHRAIDVRPDISQLHYNLAATYQRLGRVTEAERFYNEAIRLKPEASQPRYNLATLLVSENRADQAVAQYQVALSLNPNSSDTLNNLGSLLVERGNVEEGAALFDRALRITPRKAGIYHNLARAKKFEQGNPMVEAMEELCTGADLSIQERIQLHFALGKVYADVQQYQDASRHLVVGNSLKRSVVPYNEAATLSAFGRLTKIFTREMIEKCIQKRNTTALPIFILGMPRSGTTLVEQILASHPLVTGSGEFVQIEKAFTAILPGQQLSSVFPDIMQRLSGERLHKLGKACVRSMQLLGPQAAHVTDKSISNFMLAGLIHLSLPKARMIHIRRDPIDTCLSCFSTLFADDSQPFTYDLGEVTRYYNYYRTTMAHWRRVLPTEILLDIDYEDIVNDFEPNVRRLLDYCGLVWNDACLAFHKSNRSVKTASSVQVRQPIYKTSVGRWHGYISLIGSVRRTLCIKS